MDHHLLTKFNEANVPLRIAASPREFDRRLVDRSSEAVFMINVRPRSARGGTGRRRDEFIQMYCGAQAQVRAIAASPTHRQVLLDVVEPQSTLTTREWDRVRREPVEREIVIPGSHRRLLVGMDESHLFVCSLTRHASSVEEAHRHLQPDPVREAHHAKVKRQGEWFFVPVTASQVLADIQEAITLGQAQSRSGIQAGGRPHVVEQLVRLGERAFVLGTVRHPDHRTLRLKGWHQVHRNTEAVGVPARPQGMTWVD